MNSKKNKILIVHNFYQIPGGEDTVVANEKKMLEDNGHEVISYTRHNSEIKEFSLVQKLLLPFETIFNLRTYKEIKKIIKDENIDIVHVHNTLNLISPAVYYAAVKCKVPVVQTIHNFRFVCPSGVLYRDGHICEDCINKGMKCALKHGCYRGSKLQTLLCVISSKLHKMTGIYKKIKYICLTDFNKDKLLNFKQIKPEQIYVKPNFSFSDFKDINYNEKKNQFVFVGRTEKLKGIDVLFKAWNLMGEKAPKLIVCGTGDMEQWCHDFIKENDIKNIDMLGFIDNARVKQIVAESKALILPSQCYEGFPMTIAEAYSVGTAAIGSDIGNVKGLIDEGKTGYTFSYQSPEDLAKKVEEFSIDDNRFIKDIYRNNLTKEINYIKLNEIYSAINL